MNKFNKLYKEIKTVLNEDINTDLQNEKLHDAITEKFYEIKYEIAKKIFSDEAENSMLNQLDFHVLNNEMVGKKLGSALYKATDIDNFEEFEINDAQISSMIINFLEKHFVDIFINHVSD